MCWQQISLLNEQQLRRFVSADAAVATFSYRQRIVLFNLCVFVKATLR